MVNSRFHQLDFIWTRWLIFFFWAKNSSGTLLIFIFHFGARFHNFKAYIQHQKAMFVLRCFVKKNLKVCIFFYIYRYIVIKKLGPYENSGILKKSFVCFLNYCCAMQNHFYLPSVFFIKKGLFVKCFFFIKKVNICCVCTVPTTTFIWLVWITCLWLGVICIVCREPDMFETTT